MKFAYSTYTSDTNEMLSGPISYAELLSDTGYMYALEWRVDITGVIIRDSYSNLVDRIGELKSIIAIRGANYVYTTNDDLSTGLSVASPNTVGGLGISNFALTQSMPGEMGLFANYSMTISGIIPVGAAASGNPIVEFEQTFRMINPDCNGEFVTVPIQGDQAQRQNTYISLPGHYIQTGRIVFLYQPPFNVSSYIPGPIVPADVHWTQAELSRLGPRKKQNGVGLLWPVEYSYPHESVVPYSQAILQPSISYSI